MSEFSRRMLLKESRIINYLPKVMKTIIDTSKNSQKLQNERYLFKKFKNSFVLI